MTQRTNCDSTCASFRMILVIPLHYIKRLHSM